MAIVKMKKLRLYGAAEEQTQLIRELQLLGCVEIGEPQQLTDTDGEAVFHAADSGQTDELVRTAARLTSALETLKKYDTAKGGLFAARPGKTVQELFDDGAYHDALQAAQQILDARELCAVAGAAASPRDGRHAAHARAARHRACADVF